MLKKEIRSHLLTTIVWLAIITLLRWQWYLSFSRQLWNSILLWWGGLLGTFLLDIDHLLYALVIYPHELTSLRVKRLFKQRRSKDAIALLMDTQDERLKLPFHNALFQLIFYVFCFFVLTSTGSIFGAGLVMTMALHLLKDELGLLLKGKDEHLRKWLFWPVKGEVSLQNQKFFVILMLLVFLGLNLLLI